MGIAVQATPHAALTRLYCGVPACTPRCTRMHRAPQVTLTIPARGRTLHDITADVARVVTDAAVTTGSAPAPASLIDRSRAPSP